MVSLYILIKEIVIYCSGITNHCIVMPFSDMNLLLKTGFVELIFEMAGVVQIYRNRDYTMKKMEADGKVEPTDYLATGKGDYE